MSMKPTHYRSPDFSAILRYLDAIGKDSVTLHQLAERANRKYKTVLKVLPRLKSYGLIAKVGIVPRIGQGTRHGLWAATERGLAR